MVAHNNLCLRLLLLPIDSHTFGRVLQCTSAPFPLSRPHPPPPQCLLGELCCQHLILTVLFLVCNYDSRCPILSAWTHVWAHYKEWFSVSTGFCLLKPRSGVAICPSCSEVSSFHGCHGLPIAIGQRSGVPRSARLCPHCHDGSVGGKLYIISECAFLQPVQIQYANLFPDNIQSMSQFSQADFGAILGFVLSCLTPLGV